MYHIKPDKRSQSSAKLICQGLIECMSKKEFTQITITDIQRATGVGRSTFYRLFDNISDVVSYICDKQFSEAISDFPNIKSQPAETVAKRIISSMMEKEEVITAIAKSGRMDILFTSAKSNAITFRELISQKHMLDKSKQMTDNQIDYFIATFLCSMIACLSVWINHGRSETVDEVYENMTLLSKRIEEMNS